MWGKNSIRLLFRRAASKCIVSVLYTIYRNKQDTLFCSYSCIMHAHITGTAHRLLSGSKYEYMRNATSCKEKDPKFCTVQTFANCDAAAIAAKLPATSAQSTNRDDRPPGCFLDTNTNTLYFNMKIKQSYPAGSRYGLLCELCPDCPGEGSCADGAKVKGDKYCDDGNNNCVCDWDGGDCCGEKSDRTYCKKCQCLDPDFNVITTSKATDVTTTTKKINYRYVAQKGGFCKDKKNCKITTSIECDIAAAELEQQDTKHTKQVWLHACRQTSALFVSRKLLLGSDFCVPSCLYAWGVSATSLSACLFINLSTLHQHAVLHVFCTVSKQQGARLLCQHKRAVIFQSTGRYNTKLMNSQYYARWCYLAICISRI